MNDKPKFKKWNEPATIGDVVTAMIWTQGLVGSLFKFMYAAQFGKVEERKEAFENYRKEWSEFNEKVDEIGGAKGDD